MPAAAARKPKVPPREALCRELLKIRIENADVFARIDAIGAKLKAIGIQDGAFRETFENIGYVSVSPAKPAQTIGNAPALQVDAWEKLTAARRDKLLEQGLVKITTLIKKAFHGQVRVKLHSEPEGDDE